MSKIVSAKGVTVDFDELLARAMNKIKKTSRDNRNETESAPIPSNITGHVAVPSTPPVDPGRTSGTTGNDKPDLVSVEKVTVKKTRKTTRTQAKKKNEDEETLEEILGKRKKQ